VANIEPATIAEFIKVNKISARLNNVLHIAMDAGYVYVSELTDNTMRKLRSCGVGTLQEFQSLITKNNN